MSRIDKEREKETPGPADDRADPHALEDYRTIFEAMNDGICIHDVDTGKILDVNRSFVAMCGYTLDEARKLDLGALSSGEPPYTHSEALERIRKTAKGEPQLFDWMAKDKAGRLFWVGISLKRAVIWGRDCVLVVARDISKRKQAERALRESEARLRAILDWAPIGIALVDRDGRSIESNTAFQQILGYTAEEIRGRAFAEFTHPDDVAGSVALLRDLMDGRRGQYEIEKRYIRKDGRVVCGRLIVSPLPDASGRPELAIGMVEDITENKRAEDELRKSNRMVASILESITEGFFAVDNQWRFTYVNSRAEKMLRTLISSEEPFLGRSVWDFFPGIADTAPEAPATASEVEFFYPALKRWFEVHTYPSEEGRSVYFRDITDRKAAEEELVRYRDQLEALVENRTTDLAAANELLQREMAERQRVENDIRKSNAQLKATNKELEAFSYSVSHDLRAPLRAIDGFTEALLDDYGETLEERALHYLRRVRAGAQRMGALIDDLLNLSRVTRAEMQWASVDLSALVQSIATELERTQPQRSVSFVVADGALAGGDETLLRVMLDNLLGNAWKYTSKHPTARIEFGVVRGKGEPVYFVRDDGAGFEMTHADRLFAPFQRLHGGSEFEGTGIGLATVQRIITRHGGRVWVAEAAPEQGATFCFTLPHPGA